MPVRNAAAKGEQGAVAIMVAITSVALIGLAAMVVDLGNAFVQRRDIQAQADFSRSLVAPSLPGSKTGTDPSVVTPPSTSTRTPGGTAR